MTAPHGPVFCGHLHAEASKYGRNGYLKLWIPWSDNAKRLSALQDLIDDDKAVRAETERIYDQAIV